MRQGERIVARWLVWINHGPSRRGTNKGTQLIALVRKPQNRAASPFPCLQLRQCHSCLVPLERSGYAHGTDLAKRVVHASASGESRAFNGAGTRQENTKPTNMTVNDIDQRKYPMQIVSTIPAAAHARAAQIPRITV